MISINDTIERPKAAPTYRVRTEAMAAAVFELGPHARNGFEYETIKCDGRWRWKSTDEVRPPTPAQIKANGGKKSLIQTHEATPMAKSNETTIMPACNGLDVAKPDDLDIPEFLKRASGPLTRKEISSAVQKAASSMGLKAELAPAGTYDELKASGALRSEPVAKPEGKTSVSRKPAKAKTADPAKKRASEAETKTAGAPKGKTKTALVGEMLRRPEGCTKDEMQKALGWKTVGVTQQAREAGISSLRKEREDGVMRYWAA